MPYYHTRSRLSIGGHPEQIVLHAASEGQATAATVAGLTEDGYTVEEVLTVKKVGKREALELIAGDARNWADL